MSQGAQKNLREASLPPIKSEGLFQLYSDFIGAERQSIVMILALL